MQVESINNDVWKSLYQNRRTVFCLNEFFYFVNIICDRIYAYNTQKKHTGTKATDLIQIEISELRCCYDDEAISHETFFLLRKRSQLETCNRNSRVKYGCFPSDYR